LPLELELYSNSGVLHAYWSDSADPAHLPLAEAFYRRAFALAPNRADLRDALGHVYHNRARYTEALAQYAAAIEIDPQFAAAHFDSGLAFLALGQHEQARAAFQAALRLAPRCAECRDQLDALGP
jgi:tetratricopeptide (TPR) repeat protein